MHRLSVFLLIFLFACRAFYPPATLSLREASTPAVILTEIPTAHFGLTPGFELLETAAPPTLPPPLPRLKTPYSVRVHPDGKLYVGDQVSFEVMVLPNLLDRAEKIQVEFDRNGEKQFAEAPVAPYGIGGRLQATFTWVWDTSGLAPGDHSLVFKALPSGDTWTETISLLPRSVLPWAEKQAEWASATSKCCTVYYITGTAAQRDLPKLLELLDEQARAAERRMGVQANEPITVTLIPRLLGQGGFAQDEIFVSYLDRNYADGDIALILHHELVHVLDKRQAGELRSSLLAEGLAVYLTGGHFKLEPLIPRAAVLLETAGNSGQPGLGWYISLRELAERFYVSQHEIGYLEAGALVEYMVERWGWWAFERFYHDIQPKSAGSPAKAIEDSLIKHFNLTLAELEADFIARLRRQPVEAGLQTDVRLTVQYYDAVRRYQEMMDPSAHYLNAWLPPGGEMRKRNIVADFLRRQAGTAHLALESLLAETGEDLKQGRFAQVERNLTAVNRVLDAILRGEPEPFTWDARALDYYQVTQTLQGGRFWFNPSHRGEVIPQRIRVRGDMAEAWVSLEGAELRQVTLRRTPAGWRLQVFREGRRNREGSAFATCPACFSVDSR